MTFVIFVNINKFTVIFLILDDPPYSTQQTLTQGIHTRLLEIHSLKNSVLIMAVTLS